MIDSTERRHAIDFRPGAPPTQPGAKLVVSSLEEMALRDFVQADDATWELLL